MNHVLNSCYIDKIEKNVFKNQKSKKIRKKNKTREGWIRKQTKKTGALPSLTVLHVHVHVQDDVSTMMYTE